RIDEGAIGGGRLVACHLQSPIEVPALEVVPEAGERGARRAELGELRLRARVLGFRRAQRALDTAAPREQAAIALGEKRAPLTLLLRRGKLADVLREYLPSVLPERAQLIEHERRIGGLDEPEAALESGKHLLNACRCALLLLDPVLEPIDLLLQLAIGLLELGPILEKQQYPLVVGSGGGREHRPDRPAHDARERRQRFHDRPATAGRARGDPSADSRGRREAMSPLHAILQPLV